MNTKPQPTEDDGRRRRFWGRVIKWSLVVMIVPPLLSTIPTIWSMISTFSDLQSTGQADPKLMAEDVSTGFKTTMWAMNLACPAFVVLLIAVIRYFSLPGAVPRPR